MPKHEPKHNSEQPERENVGAVKQADKPEKTVVKDEEQKAFLESQEVKE